MTLYQVDLKQRLEYLSRAIMCVKSGELGGESSRVGVGELLHDLEEKMEVARVQLQIVDALSGGLYIISTLQLALNDLNHCSVQSVHCAVLNVQVCDTPTCPTRCPG